jgi:hypothetical protein
VKTGASAALEAITKPAPKAPLERPPPRAGAAGAQGPLAPLFGEGLLGRALGGLVAGAVKSLGEQMEAAARCARRRRGAVAELGGPLGEGAQALQARGAAASPARPDAAAPRLTL